MTRVVPIKDDGGNPAGTLREAALKEAFAYIVAREMEPERMKMYQKNWVDLDGLKGDCSSDVRR